MSKTRWTDEAGGTLNLLWVSAPAVFRKETVCRCVFVPDGRLCRCRRPGRSETRSLPAVSLRISGARISLPACFKGGSHVVFFPARFDGVFPNRSRRKEGWPDGWGFSRLRLSGRFSTGYFVSRTRLPPAIIRPPSMARQERGSFRMMKERMMVMTTLSLSTGATNDTSPFWRALK